MILPLWQIKRFPIVGLSKVTNRITSFDEMLRGGRYSALVGRGLGVSPRVLAGDLGLGASLIEDGGLAHAGLRDAFGAAGKQGEGV